MCLEKSCLSTCELFSAFQFLHTQILRVDFSTVLAAVFFLTLSVLFVLPINHMNVSYQIIFCCSASNSSEYKSFSLLVHLGLYFLVFVLRSSEITIISLAFYIALPFLEIVYSGRYSPLNRRVFLAFRHKRRDKAKCSPNTAS